MSAVEPDGEQLAAVSDAIVGIYSESYGRGPTRAKTYAFDDYLLCVLEDILTTVEKTLVENGQERLVRTVRLRFQESEAKQFTDAVEKVVGRRVIAYHSQVTFDPAVGFEMFVLAEAPSEDGAADTS